VIACRLACAPTRRSFDFETAKIQMMSKNVRVAVNVQPDLILKGVGSEVNFLPNQMMVTSKAMSESADSIEAGRSIYSYSNNIRYLEDLNMDGIPDRKKTIIYGPSFGINLGYSPCTPDEIKYFKKNNQEHYNEKTK